MLSLETIEREINELEAHGQTTYALCERLSWLYICRDHLKPPTEESRETVGSIGGSEFLDACEGVPYQALLKLVDEHMTAIRAVFPKAYEDFMAKVMGLR